MDHEERSTKSFLVSHMASTHKSEATPIKGGLRIRREIEAQM